MTVSTRKLKKIRKKSYAYQMKLEGKNRHHIIPSSRENGTDTEDNIVYINVDKHAKYHHLFGNRTPDEIVNYLVDYFWKGNLGFVFEAIANRKMEVENELQRH